MDSSALGYICDGNHSLWSPADIYVPSVLYRMSLFSSNPTLHIARHHEHELNRFCRLYKLADLEYIHLHPYLTTNHFKNLSTTTTKQTTKFPPTQWTIKRNAIVLHQTQPRPRAMKRSVPIIDAEQFLNRADVWEEMWERSMGPMVRNWSLEGESWRIRRRRNRRRCTTMLIIM